MRFGDYFKPAIFACAVIIVCTVALLLADSPPAKWHHMIADNKAVFTVADTGHGQTGLGLVCGPADRIGGGKYAVGIVIPGAFPAGKAVLTVKYAYDREAWTSTLLTIHEPALGQFSELLGPFLAEMLKAKVLKVQIVNDVVEFDMRGLRAYSAELGACGLPPSGGEKSVNGSR